MAKLTTEQVASFMREMNQNNPDIPMGMWGDEDYGVYVIVIGPSDGNQAQMAAIANAMLASSIVNKINEIILMDMATPKEKM